MTNQYDDENFKYLNEFLNWLEKWENMGCDTGILSKETMAALKLTTYGLLELTSYCINELKLQYILPGKFQTDSLENRFSQYRQLSGSNYHISIRQLFESEKKIRIHSLLKLSLPNCEITISNINSNLNFEDSMPIQNDYVPSFNVIIEQTDLNEIQECLPIIVYISGYCSFSVLKRVKCDSCSSFLKLNKDIDFEIEHGYIQRLDRGKLHYPTENVVLYVSYTYVTVKKLVKDFHNSFFQLDNQKHIVTSIALNNIEKNKILEYDVKCANGHFLLNTARLVVWCATNIFLNNYCKKK